MKKIVLLGLITYACCAMEKSPKRMSLEKQKSELNELLLMSSCIPTIMLDEPQSAVKMINYIKERTAQIEELITESHVSNESLSLQETKEIIHYIIQALDDGIANKIE